MSYGKALPRGEHRRSTRDGVLIADGPAAWYRGLSGAELVAEMRQLTAPKRPASTGTRAAAGLGVAIYNGSNHYERGDISLMGLLVSIEWNETPGKEPTWHPGKVTDEKYRISRFDQKVEYLVAANDDEIDSEWVDFDNETLRFDVVRTGEQHANGAVGAPIGGELVPAHK